MSCETYALFRQPYYDTQNQQYVNLVTINMMPKGALSRKVRRVNLTNLVTSEFNDVECEFATVSFENPSKLMNMNELPMLFAFMMSTGYTIDTSLTKMLNSNDIQTTNKKLITFIVQLKKN